MQVRNKWLRILETSGGRSGSMTGAAGPYRGAYPADGTTHGSQAGSYGNSTASTRGRGRGRGSQRGRGGGRGGNRVVPRQATPPALVSYTRFRNSFSYYLLTKIILYYSWFLIIVPARYTKLGCVSYL
jgi:hypothetical protein